MMRLFLVFLMLFISLPPCAAQEPSAETFLSFHGPGGGYARKLMPMGNTINDNIDLFFEDRNAQDYFDPFPLAFRNVGPTGTKGALKTLVDDIDFAAWTVAWHPQARRYMLIYRKANKLYAMAVFPNGDTLPAVYITNYSETSLDITWTKKNKFILFLKRGDKIAAQVLRNNGKKFRGEKTVAEVTGGSAVFGSASSLQTGLAVFYYGEYLGGDTALRIVLLDQKLRTKADRQVLAPRDALLYFRGLYDTFNKMHGVVWNEDGKFWYCTFDSKANVVGAPQGYYIYRCSVRGLRYDRSLRHFVIWYSTWEIDNVKFLEIDYHYFCRFTADGTLINLSEAVKTISVNNEIDAYGLNFARNGNYLLCWSHEELSSAETGTYGWLFH